jgi:predicted permease
MRSQLLGDRFAMTLSAACIIHCFFVPSFLILSSGFLSFSIDNEFIHKMIVMIAIPVSIFSFSAGYKNHKTIMSFLPLGIIGLFVLSFAVVFGEEILGEFIEKGLTLVGSMLVAYSHFKNYKACKNADCNCHEA